ERRQLSFISQFTAGRANNIAAQNMLYSGSGTPVVTPEGVAYFGSFPHDFGGINWPAGAQFGSYFPSDTFVRVTDPQCGMLSTLNGFKTSSAGVVRCTLQALARPLPQGTTGVPGQMNLP